MYGVILARSKLSTFNPSTGLLHTGGNKKRPLPVKHEKKAGDGTCLGLWMGVGCGNLTYRCELKTSTVHIMLNIVFLFLSRTRTHYLKIESKKFIQPLPGPMMVEDTLPMDEKINIDNMETFPILGAGGDEGRGNETDQVPIDDQYPIVEEHEEPEELGIKDTSPTPPKLPQLPPVPPSPPKVPVPKINFSF